MGNNARQRGGYYKQRFLEQAEVKVKSSRGKACHCGEHSARWYLRSTLITFWPKWNHTQKNSTLAGAIHILCSAILDTAHKVLEGKPLININALRFHHLTVKLLVHCVMIISSRQRTIPMWWRLWWVIDRWVIDRWILIHGDRLIDMVSPLTQTCSISVQHISAYQFQTRHNYYSHPSSLLSSSSVFIHL